MIKIIKKGIERPKMKFNCEYCTCEYVSDEYDDEKHINDAIYEQCPNCRRTNVMYIDNNTKVYSEKCDKND